MDPSLAPWAPFLLGLAVTAGLTVPALLLSRIRLARAERHAASAAERTLAAEQARARAEEDLRFLTQFLKDYPRLARELYSGVPERQLPNVLLSVVQRSLEAQQVAVLVLRPEGAAGPKPRLVVAAVYPPGGGVRLGGAVPVDCGEIGRAAEKQGVMNRQDLEADAFAGRIRPGPPLEGMPQPDLIAPLVFDQETLGVILVRQMRPTGDPKTALQLVAQTGAQVLHTAAKVRLVETTAELDGLTSVFNKKHLQRRLERLIFEAACIAYDQRAAGGRHEHEAGAEPTSVFLFDIDHFKHYNDNNGHLAGDQLLQEIARMVSENVRKEDVFGRFGGEEFLLIQPRTEAVAALQVAEKLRKLIASHPFKYGDTQPLGYLSVSGGVAQCPLHGLDASGVLRAADAALYEAKRGGRDRVLLARAPELPVERRP